MKVLIIEDEQLAVKRLVKLLSEINGSIEVVRSFDTVTDSASWLISNDAPDLIFMDIQLADGISFEIFEQVQVDAPIIFITAYDQYALNAFKVNSIDYLLKPLEKQALQEALTKYEKRMVNTQQSDIEAVIKTLTHQYKNRFLIKTGEHIKSLPTSDIRYFFSRDKASYCVSGDGRNYLLDYTMDQIIDMLDPLQYFRINRAYIVSYNAIEDIISYTNSRLRLVLSHSKDENVIVSRERVQDFKRWLD